MITVSNIAKQAEVSPDTIRHYVRIGLLQPSRNITNGYKEFISNDVNRVRFIRWAKSLGYTLAEIGQIFHDADTGDSPCPRVRNIIQNRIKENKIKLQQLLVLQERMETALEQWKYMPDGTPDGQSVCHLIESIVRENQEL